MSDHSLRQQLNLFSTITLTLIILLVIISTTSIISNFSIQSKVFDQLKINKTANHGYFFHSDYWKGPFFWNKNRLKPGDLRLLNSSDHLARRFDSRVEEFFGRNQCKVRVFMTWIAPADTFGEREFMALESLFESNPESCLVIVSRTMDSRCGYRILEPLIARGFRVGAITPDLWSLFKHTPAKSWLKGIKNGDTNPGTVPLAQNLSNLIRLGVLYKYGGVYLDTDFIVLKDLSSLRNTIGAQSADSEGDWTRLNNAFLAFDKDHPLLYEFIDQFAENFNGNKWGHNGPYLVTRVAVLNEFFNFTVLPPMAFYPVHWNRVASLFSGPGDRFSANWISATTRQIEEMSYGVHLWNRQSRKLRIEEGSIVRRLTSKHCVICNRRDV